LIPTSGFTRFWNLKNKDPRHSQAKQLISSTKNIIISEQVLAEVSVNLLKKGGFAEKRLLLILESFYSRYKVVVSHPFLHEKASKIRTKYSLSYWDSMIIAAALDADCTVLLTEDIQHGQIIYNSLKIINPFKIT